MAKNVISQPSVCGSEFGVIAADHPGLFQAADAAQAGRRGDARAPRQFDVGHSPVGLQFRQDATVDRVEDRHVAAGTLHAARILLGADHGG